MGKEEDIGHGEEVLKGAGPLDPLLFAGENFLGMGGRRRRVE